jgi:hypothetical protein
MFIVDPVRRTKWRTSFDVEIQNYIRRHINAIVKDKDGEGM